MQIIHTIEPDSIIRFNHHIGYADDGNSISILFTKDDPVIGITVTDNDVTECKSTFNKEEFTKYLRIVLYYMERLD